ncbi:MAG: hypothetical protein IPO22_14030 [Anaerolineales bacterium]|nr:hypothetical protein [Anaerolineales bacterium]
MNVDVGLGELVGVGVSAADDEGPDTQAVKDVVSRKITRKNLINNFMFTPILGCFYAVIINDSLAVAGPSESFMDL